MHDTGRATSQFSGPTCTSGYANSREGPNIHVANPFFANLNFFMASCALLADSDLAHKLTCSAAYPTDLRDRL
jgi:hypothetical protein